MHVAKLRSSPLVEYGLQRGLHAAHRRGGASVHSFAGKYGLQILVRCHNESSLGIVPQCGKTRFDNPAPNGRGRPGTGTRGANGVKKPNSTLASDKMGYRKQVRLEGCELINVRGAGLQSPLYAQ